MRAGGTMVTTPLIRAGDAGVILTNVQAFFNACGAPCDDPSSPAYVDIIAINAFCGPWNGDDCSAGVSFIVNEALQAMGFRDRPVYITNWSYLSSNSTAEQVLAIASVDGFFVEDSPIERVYWFGAQDFGGGTTNNHLTSAVVLEGGEETTLGALWKAECDLLP